MIELEKQIHKYFGIASEEDLRTIISFFKYKTVEKGDFILKSNKRCLNLSFVQSGLFRIFADSGDKEITQWVSSSGYFITDLASFMYNSPARWNIQALVDSEIYTINKEDYLKLHKMVPSWSELEKQFIIKCFIILEERIFSHLSMSAEERYNYFFENNRELFNQVPLQYLASLLGMTPETISRIRKKQLP